LNVYVPGEVDTVVSTLNVVDLSVLLVSRKVDPNCGVAPVGSPVPPPAATEKVTRQMFVLPPASCVSVPYVAVTPGETETLIGLPIVMFPGFESVNADRATPEIDPVAVTE
jgi:hypothetical protein